MSAPLTTKDRGLAPGCSIRVAIVITELDFGGAEQCATDLAIFLANRGHQVRMLALGPPPVAPHDALVYRLESAGIEVRFGRALGTLHALRSVLWLRTQLGQYAPDIVQSFLWHANICCSIAMLGCRTPLIGGIRVSEPRRWRWALERWAARRMMKVVCVSEDVRRHAEVRQRLPSEKLIVIPNGIEVQVLTDELFPVASASATMTGELKLIFVGRLEPQKGIAPLVERLPELLGKMPMWTLTLIGKGSLEAHLKACVRASGMTDRVRFEGWQPRAIRWMYHGQIVVLPAIYEGMPNVLLEAMSVGRPFVAFAVDGIAPLLADGYPRPLAEAQLVVPGDWPGFVDRVHALAADSSLRSQCGLANQSHVESHFRLSDQLGKYEALYLTSQF